MFFVFFKILKKYATFDFGDGQNPENQYCQEPESYSVENKKIFLSRTKPDYFAWNLLVCMRNSYEKYQNWFLGIQRQL